MEGSIKAITEQVTDETTQDIK